MCYWLVAKVQSILDILKNRTHSDVEFTQTGNYKKKIIVHFLNFGNKTMDGKKEKMLLVF